jgi:hypothetical protein
MTDLPKLPLLLREYRKLAALRHPSPAEVARREQLLDQFVRETGQYHPRVAVAEAERLARKGVEKKPEGRALPWERSERERTSRHPFGDRPAARVTSVVSNAVGHGKRR